MLIDSHCHLDHPQFAADGDAVLERARRAGVRHMLTIGTTVAGFPGVRAIAERHAGVSCTLGIHPHDAAAEADVTIDDLVRLADHPKVVAIGECGLDYHYNRSPQGIQVAVFRKHIAAARQSGLPLVVHTRNADEAMAAILAEEHARGPFTGVLHCFSAGPALAAAAVRLGFRISFSGIITFKKSEALRAIARSVPRDRLLVETDAPYLAPVPMRGRRNEPAFVPYTLATLAECRGEDETALAEAISANFFALFPKARAGGSAASAQCVGSS
jgi:TatD DNase family protein